MGKELSKNAANTAMCRWIWGLVDTVKSILTKKMKVNEGEVPQYYVQDSHTAIVDEELFDLVHMELTRLRALKEQYSGNGCFASRIVCYDVHLKR